MTYVFYNTILALLNPLSRIYLILHPKHRVLLQRFTPVLPEALPKEGLWVQACSAGEVGLAREFIKVAAIQFPDIPQLLTVSTATGFDLASQNQSNIPVAWCPFDGGTNVRNFVARLHPCMLVLLETELWPNLIRETRSAGTPVCLINGRLSDKHLKHYQRYRKFLQPIVEQLSLACMQNAEYAERLIALGAAPQCVHVTGNIKFDSAVDSMPEAHLSAARMECGFAPTDQILIFGSTRPGDEALALKCWHSLRDVFPSLKIVIAPRHIQRSDEIEVLVNEPLLRRSELKNGRKPNGERILLLDTIGELVVFYGLADLAVVGGSFYPGVNGHNPIEPTALGVATVFGPFMRNFVDAARELTMQKGSIQASDPEVLPGILRGLLENESQRRHLAEAGRAVVMANRGATMRTLDLMKPLLEKRFR